MKRKTNESRTYVEEQKELKESFKKFLHSDVESSDDESACAGFLKVKTKTATEKVSQIIVPLDIADFISNCRG